MLNPPNPSLVVSPASELSAWSEVSLADLWQVLRKRRSLVWLAAGVGLIAGVLLALVPRQYVADGSLWIKPGTASVYRSMPTSILADEVNDRLASEAQILQSRTLYLRVAGEQKLLDDPAFAGPSLNRNAVKNSSTREQVFRRMSQQISVTHNPKDQIVRIRCTSRSPQLSARIVNALITDYIEEMFTLHYGASQRTSSWLMNQLEGMKRQVERDQADLVELQGRLGVLGFDPRNADYLQAQSLDLLTKAAGEATLQRIVDEAKYRFLQSSDPSLIEGGQQILGPREATNPSQGTLIQSLRSTQAQLAASFAHLLAQYGPNYPEVKQARAELEAINSQVDKEQQRILNQARLAFLASAANQKMTRDALDEKKAEAFRNKSDMVRYVLLEQQYASHRDLYQGLVQRLEEATFTSGLESSEVDVVDMAEIPSIPKPPGPALDLLGGVCGGLIAGCSMAWIAEAFDPRVQHGLEASRLLGVPLLAALPHIPHAEQQPGRVSPPKLMLPEVLLAPRSPYSEALQSIPIALRQSARPEAPNVAPNLAPSVAPNVAPSVVMITSARSGEGKSFTACNLAVILSQHGYSTLLVDCDLRSGRIARRLGLPHARGLSSILAGRLSLRDACHPVPGCPRLSVLPCGAYPSLPAVLLASQRMAELVEEAKRRFDFILLDSPPLLGVSDALSLGRLADATLLITRNHLSTKKLLVQLRARITTHQLAVLGCVHNDVDPRLNDYGYPLLDSEAPLNPGVTT